VATSAVEDLAAETLVYAEIRLATELAHRPRVVARCGSSTRCWPATAARRQPAQREGRHRALSVGGDAARRAVAPRSPSWHPVQDKGWSVSTSPGGRRPDYPPRRHRMRSSTCESQDARSTIPGRRGVLGCRHT